MATAVLTRPYRPLAPRARPAVGLLIATIGLDVLALAADGWNWSLVRAIRRGDVVSQSSADLSDTLVSLVGVVQFLLLVATAIYVIQWFKRAYDDLDALGAERRFGSGWAIWGWFVPFLSLWRPKQIANDIWHGGSRDREPVTPLIGWWWAAWIVSTWLDNLVLRTSLAGSTSSAFAAVVSDVLDAVAAVLAILVVRLLTERLDAAAPEPEPVAFLPEDA